MPTPHSIVKEHMATLHSPIIVSADICRHFDRSEYVSFTVYEFIELYDYLFLDHLTAAIIAHAIRVAPGIDEEEFRSMFLKTVAKELSSAIEVYDHVPLDFSSIFSSDPTHRSNPICSRMPPEEEVASDTYLKFCDLRHSLSGKTIFPRGGHRTVGRKVVDSFWQSYRAWGCVFMHEEGRDTVGVTVDDCLRLYLETGGYPDGPVEMRTSWTYSQINPRVYYARGGNVQAIAQYMQEIVNIIIDAFPEVHRVDRFSPPSAPLADDDVEIIYDYASFTSTLDAIVPFVDALSGFFTGVIVRIVDPREGLLHVDLGSLFAEYNRVCNQYQQFDISRLNLTDDPDTLLAHTCGMLGVEGNIFLATLLHGLFLRFLSGLHRSKCVGDDARFHHKTRDGMFSDDDKEYVFWVLNSIGILNFDKITAFVLRPDNDQAFRYIKRPVYRSENIMISGLLLTLPSQIPLTGAYDDFHTIRPTKAHPCRVVFKQIIRFLDNLETNSVTIKEEFPSHPIVIHIAFLCRLLREKDSDGRYSEVGRSNYRTFYRLPPVELWGRIRYVKWLVGEVGFDELVRFPRLGGADEPGVCDGRAGSHMYAQQSKARSFLCRMGYMEGEMLYDEFSINMLGLEEFQTLLEGQYTPTMKYSILVDIPVWYTHVPNAI